jgi:hypothetical protein
MNQNPTTAVLGRLAAIDTLHAVAFTLVAGDHFPALLCALAPRRC